MSTDDSVSDLPPSLAPPQGGGGILKKKKAPIDFIQINLTKEGVLYDERRLF